MYDELGGITDRHGIFLRRDAIALGYGDRDLARALRARHIHRMRHGAYAREEHWQSLGDEGQHLLRARAALRTSRAKVALSHMSALIMLGVPVWDLPLADVHLTRLDGRAGRREAGVAQHRGRVLSGDVEEIEGTLITSATRTALDITRIAGVGHALVCVDWLLRNAMVTKADLRKRAIDMDLSPGTLTTDLVIRLADGRSESVGESRTRYMIWRAGLPAPLPQYEILDERGRVLARVDFAWPEYGVFLEFDGKVKYQDLLRDGETVLDVVLREKKREELICRLTGWRCLRIVWADLYSPEATVARIRGVLAGGPVH